MVRWLLMMMLVNCDAAAGAGRSKLNGWMQHNLLSFYHTPSDNYTFDSDIQRMGVLGEQND